MTGSGPQRAVASELSLAQDSELQFGDAAELRNVMASMRAMRRLKPDPVPRELIEELVRAATWAPSASNAQHYSFIAVTDRDKMAELGEAWRSCKAAYEAVQGVIVPGADDDATRRMMKAIDHQAEHFDETPLVIAACHERLGAEKKLADPRKAYALGKDMGWSNFRRFAGAGLASANLSEASSIYPAVQNLLLTARANGLGATLTIWHLFNEAAFRQVLGVPKTHGIYAIIPIGWPMGNFGPVRRRPVDEALHWETWGG